MEDQVYCPGVVLDEEPVADVFTPAIDRKWLAMAYIVDEQWNKLFRELVRTVVVRAVGDYGRHAVGVVIGADEMVGAGLCRAVGTVRIVFRGLVEEVIAIGKMVLS